MENAICIRGLCKHYEDFSLENLDLTVPTGTIVGFVGENGAGKTTTLKAIFGAIRTDGGSIEVLGCTDPDRLDKSQIGVVMEDSFFYETLTPRQVNSIMKSLQPGWDSAEFARLLNDYQLPEKKLIKDMSKGMRMKFRLATALAHKPKLLILDEATSGLDPVVRGEVLDYLRDYIQDESHSVLMSSHITSDLEKVADSIAYLRKGRLLFQMDRDELLEKYGVLRCSPEQLEVLDNRLKVATRKTGFTCETLVSDAAAARRALPDAVIDRASIEDIMQFYTGRDAQ
ncbi:ABC transporter ATP-binding protein [Allofournierella massiliensis]|uniref:ABC-2 type transport system ATP-binding protein n=1 Tax=Allofournierella massiliensis TaxID=1650663 RepID=A0A4R1R1G6_9FIRM|nr:ABC transporter ATP-binding protein [Fournierella massiliensis]TCL59183.1 ABC-2 type transport system ATP-binding protein [Fournierella massiliensis]